MHHPTIAGRARTHPATSVRHAEPGPSHTARCHHCDGEVMVQAIGAIRVDNRRCDMSRHGYVDYHDDDLGLGRYRGQVASAIRGKRGQAFLRELADAMDAMPEKILIAKELIDDEGDCCTIGVICKARGVDVSKIDSTDPHSVAAAVGIAYQMAAEIEYENDDGWYCRRETPQERWARMRKWVQRKLVSKQAEL